jgi:hypothetical protein
MVLPDLSPNETRKILTIARAVLARAVPALRALARNARVREGLRFAGRAAREVIVQPIAATRDDLRQIPRARDAARIFMCAVAFICGAFLVAASLLMTLLVWEYALFGTHGLLVFLPVAVTGVAATLYVFAVSWQTLRWSWELRCELVSHGPRRTLFGSASAQATV